MTDLGTLGGTWSEAYSINDTGQVVGRVYPPGEHPHPNAFLWQNGMMTTLGLPSPNEAYAINKIGQIAGWSYAKNGVYHAFVWQNGTVTDIGDAIAKAVGDELTFSHAYGINDSGDVVGKLSYGPRHGGESHAFLWKNKDKILTDLGTLGGGQSEARAVDNAGRVVGWSFNGTYHAFLWQNGMMSDLGTLGGASSYAYDINSAGQVVGWADAVSDPYRAFLWQNGVMQDLNEFVHPDSDWVLFMATAINDIGQITGWGGHHGGISAFLLTPQNCPYSISSTSESFGACGGTGTVNVTVSNGCNWTAVSNSSWIAITSGNSGNGNGTVSYSVAANPSTSSRIGTLNIAELTFTVTQAGNNQPDGLIVASGSDLAGTTQNFGAYRFSGCIYMIDASKPMFDGSINSLDALKDVGVIDTHDAKKTQSNSPSSKNLVSDPNRDRVFDDNADMKAAVSTHYFTGLVYNYYKNTHGRESWDGSGSSLTSVVHGVSIPDPNNGLPTNAYAFWNGREVVYGDGDNFAGSLDVVAHEITHGVTGSIVDFDVYFQSGALSESYSDVFAALIEKDDWLMGEDLKNPSNRRSLADPTLFGQPDHMKNYVSKPITQDRGGVHTNSGIPNKAAYLVAQALDRTKLGRIWYRALIFYLFKKAQFIDARIASLCAVKDLYSDGSPEYMVIINSFNAVGIGVIISPSNLVALANGTEVNLSWQDNSNNEQGFEIERKTGVSGSWVRIATVGANVTNYVNSGLGTNQTYFYRVRADSSSNVLNCLNYSGYSNEYEVPVMASPTNLAATAVLSSQINLSWLDNASLETGYKIERKKGASGSWSDIATVGVNITNYSDTGLEPNTQYYYRVRAYANSTTTTPHYSFYSNEDDAITPPPPLAIPFENLPTSFGLLQNYPNPFNPETEIRYQLPKPSYVTLRIFNAVGQPIRTIVDQQHQPGIYKVIWDARDSSGEPMSSGLYFYTIRAGEFQETRKALLVR